MTIKDNCMSLDKLVKFENNDFQHLTLTIRAKACGTTKRAVRQKSCGVVQGCAWVGEHFVVIKDNCTIVLVSTSFGRQV